MEDDARLIAYLEVEGRWKFLLCPTQMISKTYMHWGLKNSSSDPWH